MHDVRGTISDLFVGDEGIGQVVGQVSVNGDMMTLKIEAASPRLAVSGSGRVALTRDGSRPVVHRRRHVTRSLRPRAQSNLSPFTTAIASGNVRVIGQLTNVDELLVDATVDRLDLSFFDYRLRNAALSVLRSIGTMRVEEMRLVGQETQLDISGVVNLHDERIAVRATGDAGLGLLPGFRFEHPRLGRASLEAASRADARSDRHRHDDRGERTGASFSACRTRSRTSPDRFDSTRAAFVWTKSPRGSAEVSSSSAAASTWKRIGQPASM